MDRFKENKKVTFWIDGDILNCKFNAWDNQNRLDQRTARFLLKSMHILAQGVPMKLIVDLRGVQGTFTIAAAQLISKDFNKRPFARFETYVVDSLAMELLVKSYKRIYHTGVPYAIFNDIITARAHCAEI